MARGRKRKHQEYIPVPWIPNSSSEEEHNDGPLGVYGEDPEFAPPENGPLGVHVVEDPEVVPPENGPLGVHVVEAQVHGPNEPGINIFFFI